MTQEEELVKIHVDLSAGGETGGEAMWAKPLGANLYELRNSPFYAYEYNFLDIVRAVPQTPNRKPSVEAVVERSGHRTIWITFAESVPKETRQRLAAELNRWKAYYEGADGRYFAIDVEPDGDYEATTAQLEAWLREGVLERYRVGPARSDVREA